MKTVNHEQLKRWLDDGAVCLIDVREPFEYASEAISGSHNIPVSECNYDRICQLVEGKNYAVLMCQSGNRSNAVASQLTQQVEDMDVWQLEGGMNAWKQANQTVVSSSSKVLPLDRQVQLTVGTFILVGMLLYMMEMEWGLLFPLMIGLGLLNAGLTGWCGMAKLLAKMPWNKV